MANSILVNVYRINNNDIAPTQIGIPTAGTTYRNLTNQVVGANRVYGLALTSTGTQFFCFETAAALATLAG